MTAIIEATVVDVHHIRHTRSGNPVKVVRTDVGEWMTKPNAMCAYKVSRNWVDKRVTLILERGYIVDVREGWSA
jgi:hypothetical protein